ncbi:gamma-interferon-inducible lysosomal thiol reductase-like [Branchiostoma lanceolatum]|uniref:gamma-interferon-inducible lysosomal thiol reductase-like n=1 Tax=Branchiostoma lanceolatum TaxID=7740 RepID=UPI00345628C9
MVPFLLLVTALVAQQCVEAVESGQTCDVPPSMWCSSPAVAKACQVDESCERYLRKIGDAPAPPVSLTLYYESLCGGCQKFINEQLWPTWNKLSPIMNLTLVPYGNAAEKKRFDKWVYECQHGKQECVGNLIETCTLHMLKNISAAFPFIHCIESRVEYSDNPKKAAEKCASKMQVDFSAIEKCADGSQGNALEHEMALKTGSLNPPHTYVPWVTLNGVHTEKIQNAAMDDLLKLICDTYQGPKPDACTPSTATVCTRD